MKTKTVLTKKMLLWIMITLGLFTSCQNTITEQPAQTDALANYQFQTIANDAGTVATDWYTLQLQMILHANPAVSNLAAIRLFSYSSISLFEASRFEIKNSVSLHWQLYQMPAMPKPDVSKQYSWVISANEAMANITRDLFPALTTGNHTSIDSLEKLYNDKETAIVGADVVARSQVFGDSVASAIYAWAQSDLFNHISDPYTVPVGPGLWVPTPPAYAPPAAPYMGNCRTFLEGHSHGVTIAPPHSYSDAKGSDFYKMVNYDYKVFQALTTDQKNIATFWNDVGVGIGYTPMGHGISIITQLLVNSHANLATAETAYVKAGMAMWDATIYCWRSKYKYNQVRPVTYIRKNIDTSWLPYLVTPAHPEYPAAHAFITSAMMQAVKSVFGPNYSFTDHTYDFLGYPARNYKSLNDAAVECGISRVYGGIHYLPSVQTGHLYGQLIGDDIDNIKLTK